MRIITLLTVKHKAFYFKVLLVLISCNRLCEQLLRVECSVRLHI